MIRRGLACLSVRRLTLGASLLAAPLFVLPQTPRSGGNRQVPEPRPRPPVVKEAMAAEQPRRALCLAISPDGAALAAGCTDRLVYLLGPLSGRRQFGQAQKLDNLRALARVKIAFEWLRTQAGRSG
jgi:hypothetical protein